MMNLRHRPHRPRPRWRGLLVAAAAGAVALTAGMVGVVGVSLARTQACSGSEPLEVAPRTTGTTTMPVTGHPSSVVVTADGQAAFVSLAAWWPGDPNGLQVFHREAGGDLRPLAIIPLHSAVGGLALSPDGRVLLASLDDRVAVLDAPRAATGDLGALLGAVPTSPGSGPGELAVAGSRYVLATDRGAGRVTLLDLQRIEVGDYGPAAQVGGVDVDLDPDGLAVSPDGRYAYVVSQVQRPVLSLGPTDLAYGLLTSLGLPRRAGTLTVLALARVELDPAGAVLARVSAGCAPARVAVAPDGATVWVTARQSNEVLAYRTARLLGRAPAGPAARVRVSPSPMGIRLVRSGRFALVAGTGGPERLDVLDTAAALAGRPSIHSLLTVGGSPRDIGVAADQRTAYVTNNRSSSLTAVDLSALR